MLKRKKSLRLIFPGILILYIYIAALFAIPGNITILQGESYDSRLPRLVTAEYAVNAVEEENFFENTKVKVNLFGKIPIKTINVNIMPNSLIIQGGETIGVKINTSGLTVLMTEGFRNKEGNFSTPFESMNVQIGDVIMEVNGVAIENIEHFVQEVQKNGGKEANLKIIRNDEEILVNVTPEQDSEDGIYKIGIWVKEITSGIGTITFVDPVTNVFGALGHGISDVEGNRLIKIRDGKAFNAYILSSIKGQKGKPGELKGAIKEEEVFGTITQNTSHGIFGKVNDMRNIKGAQIEVGLIDTVKVGPAKIICNIHGNDIEEFDIEIEKVNKQELSGSKNMIIKVTDKELIESTGGIVQGMSGSPIMQDGKIIGAVTHVLINDPQRGYGVFIENMLKEVS